MRCEVIQRTNCISHTHTDFLPYLVQSQLVLQSILQTAFWADRPLHIEGVLYRRDPSGRLLNVLQVGDLSFTAGILLDFLLQARDLSFL